LKAVDDTQLKGVFNGVLLTAIDMDAENHFAPLAYVIVDVENRNN